MKLKPELTSILLESIRQAIYDKLGEDPHHKFKIEKLYKEKGKKIAEVYVQWGNKYDGYDGEHLGVEYK